MKVELIDHMGSDLSVVNAARVSFSKESDWETVVVEEGGWRDKTKTVLKDGDKRLIRFLARHNHWSPFSHTSLSFRIKAPIFVARQLGKHQVGLSWNEVSRRYVDAKPEFYIPETVRAKAPDKKQGSADTAVIHSDTLVGQMEDWCLQALTFYQNMIATGVCPEQARMILPQSMMTEWIWTGSLYAYARVCNLRLKPDTQSETRDVAECISHLAAQYFPESWKVLIDV